MELYYTFSVLIVLASFFAYLNLRFLKFPATIGIMLIAILVSILVRIFGNSLFPETTTHLFQLIKEFDFNEVLMGAMLNFLLFAGAIHVNFADLREQKLPILIYSTVSVILSAFLISALFFYCAPLLGISIPYIFCLLFGVLISPTDPIVVLGILKLAKVPKKIETKITGESLFNDGMAVVMFAVVMKVAYDPAQDLSFGSISWLFIKEGVGGLLFGGLLGITASKALKNVNDYKLSVLVTLSLVMGGHLIAKELHVSSPLAMVVAGLIIGNYGKRVAMSATTKDYLNKFWELIDEILNAILFLFIGFELLLLPEIVSKIGIGVAAIFIVLFSRMLSIVLPWKFLPKKATYTRGSLIVMVWGGIRGGVSIALVLSLPDGIYKDLLLEITYIVVLFSIVIQGLTVGKVAKKVLAKE